MSSISTAKHVLKGSKSLDFLSNKIKSTPNFSGPSLISFISNLDIDTPVHSPIREVKHTRTPRHPFYRPSEVQRLQTVLDVSKTPIKSFFADVQLNNEQYVVRDTLEVGSSFEAFDLVHKFHGRKKLNLIENKRYEVHGYELTEELSEASNKLDDLFDEGLDQFLNTHIKVGTKILTNESKLLYFIAKRLETSDVVKSTELLKTFIETIQNSRSAKKILLNYLYKVMALPKARSLEFKDHVDDVADQFFHNYISSSEDVEILGALIKCYTKHSRFEDVKSVSLTLNDLGFAPDPKAMKILIHHYVVKHKSNRTLVLKELLKFDDIIYTTLDAEIAVPLIKISKSVAEIVSILDTLDKKIIAEPDTVAIYKSLERTLVPKILFLSTTKTHQKIELITRISKHVELSVASKIEVIGFSAREGSFLLAVSLLKSVEGVIPTRTLEGLKEMAANRERVVHGSSSPGHDEGSRRVFLAYLAERGKIDPQ